MRLFALRFAATLIAANFLAGTALFAQETAGNLVIAGKVVNSVTGEPVARALVNLTVRYDPEKQADGKISRRRTELINSALSGPAGDFRFDRLPAGTYSLRAQKPGFAPVPQKQRGQAPASDLKTTTENVSLALAPLGVIEGTILNDDGEPIEAAIVEALQVNVVDGMRDVVQERSVQSDDRGHYRMWQMVPGKYYIKAAGRAGGVSRYVGAKSPVIGARESFAPFFYGGAATIAASTPLEVKQGEHLTADLAAKIRPAFTIRGTVTGFADYSNLKFQLFRNGEKETGFRIAENATRGLFEIHDVVSGTYTVRVIQGQLDDRLIGEVQLEVAEADVDGVTIQLMPLFTAKVTEQCLDCPDPRHSWSICLHPVDDRGQRICLTRGDEQILPGEYEVTTQAFGGYVESLLVGDQDRLSNRHLMVRPGVPLPDFNLSFKSDGGTINATMRIDGTPPDLHAIAVPEDSRAETRHSIWIPDLPCHISDLKPGDYTVFAVSNANVEFRNPEVLAGLKHGVKVHVEARGEHGVVLTELAQ